MPQEKLGEIGALYRVQYTLDLGAGPYLYEATMVYLGRTKDGTEQSFSLRPLAGTQTLRTTSIKSMEMVESAATVRGRHHGLRDDKTPVSPKRRLRKWRTE